MIAFVHSNLKSNILCIQSALTFMAFCFHDWIIMIFFLMNVLLCSSAIKVSLFIIIFYSHLLFSPDRSLINQFQFNVLTSHTFSYLQKQNNINKSIHEVSYERVFWIERESKQSKTKRDWEWANKVKQKGGIFTTENILLIWGVQVVADDISGGPHRHLGIFGICLPVTSLVHLRDFTIQKLVICSLIPILQIELALSV
jgi:hypothetical protein